MQLLKEVRYVFLQSRLYLGGRALSCECHLYGLARDHNDDVEGLHSLTHFLYEDADLLCAVTFIYYSAVVCARHAQPCAARSAVCSINKRCMDCANGVIVILRVSVGKT
eukprot:scaffold18648_cov124-Isochrysis_galbana.AAC.7